MNRRSHRVSIMLLAIVFLSLLTISPTCDAQQAVPRSAYLDYARHAADATWNRRTELIERWRQRFKPDNPFGYRPPGGLLETAVIYAYLFELHGNVEYAARTRDILLSYGDYRAAYPPEIAATRPDYADGVPTLPDFFTAMRYIRAFHTLHQLDQLTPAQTRLIETEIAASMEYLLRTPEWGPMNRAALRAETLAWAVRAMPSHPRAHIWDIQRRALGDDNWGNWQIEDAQIYHGVWLYAMIGYAHCLDRMDDLFRTPEMYYYAQYFLNLMCPAGMIPDFGDAHWMANWRYYLVFFETAAAQLDDPQLKWAATVIARKFIDFDDPTNIGLGYFLLDCARWGSDDIVPTIPTTRSREVMEDVQGKKIVFRNGWHPEATYMLLNYRDEGDGGLNFRDYLRDTIPVEEEKMTHGHADENSIPLLMSGESVLLHDGGYRDYMPSGLFGAYRQDYFHNRLCVRPEKIWIGQNQGEHRYSIRDAIPGQNVLEFLHNAGSYRRVRTQKVDFITLPDFDCSRTRLIDDNMGYEWDRVITYVKDPGLFVVFDFFKSRIEEYFTLANLWHTRRVLAQGDHWYDTVYDKIGRFDLPRDTHLLLLFPDTAFRLQGVEPERRHYQDELLIHQTTAHHFELGETEAFVTVLIPHRADHAPASWVDRVHLSAIEPARAALGVVIDTPHGPITVAAKADLRMDMARDWRRPRYTYDAGRIRVDDIETNGDFIFAATHRDSLHYTIVNLTRAFHRGRLLFQAKPSFFGLAFDASPESAGVGKVRYWRDTIKLDRHE